MPLTRRLPGPFFERSSDTSLAARADHATPPRPFFCCLAGTGHFPAGGCHAATNRSISEEALVNHKEQSVPDGRPLHVFGYHGPQLCALTAYGFPEDGYCTVTVSGIQYSRITSYFMQTIYLQVLVLLEHLKKYMCVYVCVHSHARMCVCVCAVVKLSALL